MSILSRPFPITYTLGWHQQEISQKEQVNPELKAMEVFIQTFFHNTHLKLKIKGMPLNRRCSCLLALLSKAKECEKERMSISSLKRPWAWTPYQLAKVNCLRYTYIPSLLYPHHHLQFHPTPLCCSTALNILGSFVKMLANHISGVICGLSVVFHWFMCLYLCLYLIV